MIKFFRGVPNKPSSTPRREKMKEMKFELGNQAKDKITGFTGTLTGFCRYLTGCDQYLLSPRVDKEGKHVGARWYDVNRIEITEADKIDLETDDKGPDEPAPLY